MLLKQKVFIPFVDGAGVSSTDEATHSSDNAVNPQVLEELDTQRRHRSTCITTSLTSDEDSDIEVLVGCNGSFNESTQSLLESALRLEGDVISNEESSDDWSKCASDSLGRWESEGGACVEVLSPESFDDYVVLDGYESDVDSELSGYEELQQSL